MGVFWLVVFVCFVFGFLVGGGGVVCWFGLLLWFGLVWFVLVFLPEANEDSKLKVRN